MQIEVQGNPEPAPGIFRMIAERSPGARPSSLEHRDYFWPDARRPVRLFKLHQFIQWPRYSKMIVLLWLTAAQEITGRNTLCTPMSSR
jgi:hypothetical protein